MAQTPQLWSASSATNFAQQLAAGSRDSELAVALTSSWCDMLKGTSSFRSACRSATLSFFAVRSWYSATCAEGVPLRV